MLDFNLSKVMKLSCHACWYADDNSVAVLI